MKTRSMSQLDSGNDSQLEHTQASESTREHEVRDSENESGQISQGMESLMRKGDANHGQGINGEIMPEGKKSNSESPISINQKTLSHIRRVSELGEIFDSYSGDNRITHILFDIKQAPNADNGKEAIVKSTVITTGGRFQGIGASRYNRYPDDREYNPSEIIDRASSSAARRAMALASFVEGGAAIVICKDNDNCYFISPNGGIVTDLEENIIDINQVNNKS